MRYRDLHKYFPKERLDDLRKSLEEYTEEDAEEEEQGVDGPDFGGWASAVTQKGLRQWAEHELGTFADMLLDTQQFGSITPVVAPFCAGTVLSG